MTGELRVASRLWRHSKRMESWDSTRDLRWRESMLMKKKMCKLLLPAEANVSDYTILDFDVTGYKQHRFEQTGAVPMRHVRAWLTIYASPVE
ncbi:unnamed protein product [Fusarium graminearum]|uniref:Uncharacterized protein n=1 Tax=Gibberella zeae TaxID=5518 RepID=A0A4E9EL96_GIBZA|nr:unnamed protein product [Fusarium graminearum]